MAESTKNGGGAAPAGARIVVVGAGFAGGSFLQNLPCALRRPAETLLVDRQEEHVFIPLIHEVAVGRIHPDSLRARVAPDGGVASYGFLRAEVTGVDLQKKTLFTSCGAVKYHYLVLAPGSVPFLLRKVSLGTFRPSGA